MPVYTSMWEYLEATGILENGTEEQIKTAKREYRRIYQREHKKRKRLKYKETTLSIPLTSYKELLQHAKAYDLSMPAFLQKAAIAYVQKRYLVPNPEQVGQVEQLLSLIYGEVQHLTNSAQSTEYQHILKRIEQMEQMVTQVLRQPLTLEESVMRESQHDPKFKNHIINLLTNPKNTC